MSPNKFAALSGASSGDSPCRVCDDIVIGPDGIQCDKCDCWVHSDAKCSEISKTQFNFMKKCKSPAIKFVCSTCRNELTDRSALLDPPDAVARNGAKLELVGAAIAALQDQNKEIMEIIKKGNKTDNSIKAQITEAIGDDRDKDERKNNIILYKIPECDPKASDAVSEAEEIQKVKNVMNFVTPNQNTSDLNGKTVIRLGRVRAPSDTYPNPKPRPIKVILHNPAEAMALRKNARKLKDNEGLNHVGISADKTWKEREEERELRTEYNRRKNTGEDVIIYHKLKKVILRSELPPLANRHNLTQE